MPFVKVYEVLDAVRQEIEDALRDALGEVDPGSQIDASAPYSAFQSQLDRRCGVWEKVPDSAIKMS